MTEKELGELLKCFAKNVEQINLSLHNMDLTLKKMLQMMTVRQDSREITPSSS